MEAEASSERLRKVLRKLQRVSKQEEALRARVLKSVMALRSSEELQALTSADADVASRCLLEYVDALDFLSVMWRRLSEIRETGSWEVHSDLVSRVAASSLYGAAGVDDGDTAAG
jgi:hypothetical protein